MRKLIMAGAFAVASVFSVTGASAATFDFAAMADNFFANNTSYGKKYEADFDQLKASASTGAQLSNGGVTLDNATGTYPGGTAHAFFD